MYICIYVDFKINKVNNDQDLFPCLRFIILSLVCFFNPLTTLSDFFSLFFFFSNLKWDFYKKNK